MGWRLNFWRRIRFLFKRKKRNHSEKEKKSGWTVLELKRPEERPLATAGWNGPDDY